MYKLNNIKLSISYFFLTVIGFFCFSTISFSQEFTSANFKVLDPVITNGGGYASSSSYQLNGSISQISIGTSSASSFGVNAGFLYFPSVTTPIVSATAGSNQVALSWTSASGVLGWTASAYDVGFSSVSGGPYSFTASLGSGLSYTKTGLSNGTTYYFVVRVEDAFGNIIATSTQVSATPVASVTPPPPPSSVGGGYTIPKKLIGDFNLDGKVDIIDLSILLYWFNKTGPEIAVYDLNENGVVDLPDISILFFYWTGDYNQKINV